MKKILAVIVCSLAVVWPVVAVTAEKEEELNVVKKTEIVKNCETVRENLKEVQRTDSKVRVYLGRYYEEIEKNFIVPMNVRLVENSMPNAEMVEDQNELTDVRGLFAQDFVGYQQSLEELIAIDCKVEPEEFYTKLKIVRQKRKVMEQDTLKLRTLVSGYSKLASQLKEKL